MASDRPNEPEAAFPEPPGADAAPSVLQRMWRVAKEWGGSLLLAGVVFHVAGQMRAPSLPEWAPDFALPTLEGEAVTLSGLRGQAVVLNFWAPWCGPCRLEVPQIRQFADAHPEVHVLGIATDGAPAELRAAQVALGMSYPVLIGDAQTTSAYRISTLPTTVVVDGDGRVSSAHTGILTRPQLELMVR